MREFLATTKSIIYLSYADLCKHAIVDEWDNLRVGRPHVDNGLCPLCGVWFGLPVVNTTGFWERTKTRWLCIFLFQFFVSHF